MVNHLFYNQRDQPKTLPKSFSNQQAIVNALLAKRHYVAFALIILMRKRSDLHVGWSNHF